MNLSLIDIVIMLVILIGSVGVVLYISRYNRSVADFLTANRSAGRYLLCVGGGMAAVGAITIVAQMQMFYRAGFTALWWSYAWYPITLLMALCGWIIYRFRETRVMTVPEFFEKRYSKKLRFFCGGITWISGVLNFGLFPAVGARFFIYFCGIPICNTEVFGITINLTMAAVMFLLLLTSLFFVFCGGQIAVIVTDFLQGLVISIAFLAVLIYFSKIFNFTVIGEALKSAPKDASLINPFHTSKVDGFNFFYFIINIIIMIYSFSIWPGEQGYRLSAKSAHEAKMANILGTWRALVLTLVVMLVPIAAYTVLNSDSFLEISNKANVALEGVDSSVKDQMTVPVVLAVMLPKGLLGLFCAAMLGAFISTHDTYLHSWGSIFVQDIILPLRKKPFSRKQHIRILRASTLLVAVVIFCFSLFFNLKDYIFMFFTLTSSVFIAGAGSLIVGGLYWKRGSTLGAWIAMITGSSMAIFSLVLQQTWASSFYPWMESSAPALLNGLKFIIEAVANNVPGINWEFTSEACPLNGQWLAFITMIMAIIGYVTGSLFSWLILKKSACNMDRLLHRGEYAIEGDHFKGVSRPPTGFRAFLPSKEFTKGDKVIYFVKLGWTILWFVVFVVGTIVNLTHDISDDSWLTFWFTNTVFVFVIGIITTIWFLVGGIFDVKDLFKTLKSKKADELDIGMVIDEQKAQ